LRRKDGIRRDRAGFERRGRGAFLLLGFLPVLLTSAVLWVAQQYRADAAWVDHTQETLSVLAGVESWLTRAESSARAYFVNRDESRLPEFTDARDHTYAAGKRLHELVADNSSQQVKANALIDTARDRLVFLERNLDLFRAGTSIETLTAVSGIEGRQLAADANEKITALRKEEERLLAERVIVRRNTNRILIALCGSVMLVGLAVAFRGNQMIQKYRESRDQAEEQLRLANEQLETRVRQRTEELERSNHDLLQFTFAASHDLNEPLRTIGIYSELLKQRHLTKLDGDSRAVLGFILKGVSRMDALLSGLRAYLDVSTTSKMSVPKIQLRGALETALMDLKAAMDECGASVNCGDLQQVRVHPVHARQLFQNLVGNAIKYRGASRPVISIASERAGDEWTIRVSDNGMGIEPQYQAQIFGLFKRLHTSDDIPGSGLGLAICKTIVHQYGGTIWVDSEAGKGSTFSFTLPDANS